MSTNALYAHRGVHRFLTSKGKENKAAMAWEARTQFKGKPLEGALTVTVDLFWPTRRKHDVDNIKALLDALTGIVWVDDSQINDLRIRKTYDRANPRVELNFQEC